MPLSTSENVQGIFARAVQDHLQKSLRTGNDWDRFKVIRRETDARLMAEQTAYKRDFTQRMAEAKQIILREESGVRLDQPLPPWADKHSDADALDRKAGERVRHDHDRRIGAIKKDELDAFRNLTAEIRAREAPAQHTTRVLNTEQTQTGPKRSGPSRS
ncbi:hypothetical protein [uncultured Roseobacter sp.]|uniref:hypothetical protein n=1 Tax=uncultured Roseobacter sp. TaxID=114847 RepID=UPI0026157961|nr:hypothetical protein [uncultured Roseobacter sp.]